MTDGSTSHRWLPVGIRPAGDRPRVQWLDFGSKEIAEPFFFHTIKLLKSQKPPAVEKTTDLDDLLNSAASVVPVAPSGVIFHVSRCGSTLLANALKTGRGVLALAEAPMFHESCNPAIYDTPFLANMDLHKTRKSIIDAFVSLYAADTRHNDPKIVIKCNAASILHISLFRSIWPDVPFVILTRNPLEVMVSNLAKPSGWIKSISYGTSRRTIFGFTHQEVQQMSMVEFCARGVDCFQRAALEQMDLNCGVYDYTDLTLPNIYKIASMFSIAMPSHDSDGLRQALQIYSKDPLAAQTYQSDSALKHSDASESVKSMAAQWATRSYHELLDRRECGISVV